MPISVVNRRRFNLTPGGPVLSDAGTAFAVASAHSISSFPNASNTGVPAGMSLTPSGTVTTISDSQIIDALHITGRVNVDHSNVTIKRCLIESNGLAIDIDQATSGLIIEDCELDGGGVNEEGFHFSDYTMRRCNVHDFVEGGKANGNTTIEDCYLHTFADYVAQEAHSDGVQVVSGSNTVFNHNTIIMNVDGGNACIFYGGGGSGDVATITNNLFAGGSYSLQIGELWTNRTVTGNRFSTQIWENGGFWGPVNFANADGTPGGPPPEVYSDNLWYDGPNAGQSI